MWKYIIHVSAYLHLSIFMYNPYPTSTLPCNTRSCTPSKCMRQKEVSLVTVLPGYFSPISKGLKPAIADCCGSKRLSYTSSQLLSFSHSSCNTRFVNIQRMAAEAIADNLFPNPLFPTSNTIFFFVMHDVVLPEQYWYGYIVAIKQARITALETGISYYLLYALSFLEDPTLKVHISQSHLSYKEDYERYI
jgi:hypothetical protein